MEIEELLRLNLEGLFPGPEETEGAFIHRVETVKKFFHTQTSAIPFHHWQWVSEQLFALYDFSPRWCSAFYSSKGLAPWQAAATWIMNGQEKFVERNPAPSGVDQGYIYDNAVSSERISSFQGGDHQIADVKPVYMIQLRDSRWVSWFIDRDELLAHEAAHAARSAFNEPKSEELFAYLTSTVKWRQVIGPIFSDPKESLLLMGIIGLGAMLQMIEAIWEFSLFSEGCFFAAVLLCVGWSFRLLRMRIRVTRAARHLAPLLRNPEMVRAVLFRMTDKEIIGLSRGEGIVDKEELRWQLLRAAYLK